MPAYGWLQRVRHNTYTVCYVRLVADHHLLVVPHSPRPACSGDRKIDWVGVCAPHGWNLTEISVRCTGNTVKSRQIRRWTAEIRQIFQR